MRSMTLLIADAIVEIEGCNIPGCGAFKAKGLMEQPVGGKVHLKLRRASREEYVADLVAEVEPPPAK